MCFCHKRCAMTRQVYFIITFLVSLIGIIESKKYKVKLISSSKCDTLTENVDLTAVTYDTGVRDIDKHTKVVVTNFTVLRPAGPITITLKIYQMKGSKKIETFKMEKVDCHNPITYQLLRVVNLKLSNDCKIVPGNYLTENINLQDFSWILAKAMVNPGRYQYVLQFYSEKGLATCNSIVCDIKELRS